jgi:hypothetical protein
LLSQNVRTLIGSRAQGLGYATTCLYDEWSMFNNIAGLARVDHLSACFTYDAHPQLKSFDRIAASFSMPVKPGALGIGVFRFGDALYSEQILSCGYASEFGLASLGIKVNYIQYNVEGFGTKGVFSFSFGGIANLTEALSVGAHITNVAQPKISELTGERVPTILTAGLSLKPHRRLLITTEAEKDLEYPLTWKSGVEYSPFKKFSFRTGFNIQPDAWFAGTGFRNTKFNFDYAFSYHAYIGTNHQASVTYHFESKKK